jgi:4-aminobutyrate aminotransferase
MKKKLSLRLNNFILIFKEANKMNLSLEELLKLDGEYIIRAWGGRAAEPVVVTRGEGVFLIGVDGKRYIDCSSGLFVMVAGHNPKKVIDAITRQAQEVIQTSMRQTTIPAIMLAKKLAEITPGKLKKTFYTTGGAESNEFALKFAKAYKQKYEVVALKGSYHGLTPGALAVTSSSRYRASNFGPLPGPVLRAPQPYCYRCPLRMEYPGCDLWCAKELENVIKGNGIEVVNQMNVAAVIVEPVQGAGGIIPPREYLPEVRRICDRNDVLLIVDEVQTGFGRTGRMFACEHWGVEPDIMTLAKGIGGGIPLGAVVCKEEIVANAFMGTTPTSAGNAVACAAGLATIQTIEEENLCKNAENMGKYFTERLLEEIPSKYVGEVRFLGLMGGLELVYDTKTKEPVDGKTMEKIKIKLAEKGVIVSTSGPLGNEFRIQPPLIINKEEVDMVVKAFKEAIEEVMG